MKSLPLALLLAALSILDLAEAGQVGRWSKCYGSPPADSFGGPDQHIPAWSPYWNRYGRANPIGYHDDNGKCKAYFRGDGKESKEAANSMCSGMLLYLLFSNLMSATRLYG